MTRPFIQIHDAETDEFVTREMTDTEFAEWQAGQVERDAEQAKSVRTQRDAKLAECDWRVIKALESNIPQDFAWAAYRQALRDMTKQSGFPWTIDWPTQP
jgi:hypothetical protein